MLLTWSSWGNFQIQIRASASDAASPASVAAKRVFWSRSTVRQVTPDDSPKEEKSASIRGTLLVLHSVRFRISFESQTLLGLLSYTEVVVCEEINKLNLPAVTHFGRLSIADIRTLTRDRVWKTSNNTPGAHRPTMRKNTSATQIQTVSSRGKARNISS